MKDVGPDLVPLSKFLDLLRAKGVKVFEGAPWSGAIFVKVELGSIEPEEMKSGPTVDPEACRCGHPHFAHVNGLCTAGCEIEQCAPPEEKEVK